MCSRLDGSPLSLELAAAWLRTLTPRQIEAGLDDRFALLVRSPRDAVPRHASLLASMAWSYDLLDERGPRRAAPPRRLRRRLRPRGGAGGLRGGGGRGRGRDGGDRAADRQVARRRAGRRWRAALPASGDDPAVRRGPAAGRGGAAGGRGPPPRPSARERAEGGSRPRARQGPLAHHARPASTTTCARRSSTGSRRTIRRAHGELAAELPWLWQMLRQGREGMDVLRRAIARAPDERSALQARLLTGMALVADTAGPLDVELDAASRAAELAAEQGDEPLLAMCLALAAVGRLYTDLDGARETALEAERIAARVGEPFVIDAGRGAAGDRRAPARRSRGGAGAAERGRRAADGPRRARRRLDRAGVSVRERAADRRPGRARGSWPSDRSRSPRRSPTTCGSGWVAAPWRSRSGPRGDVPAGLDALEPILPLVTGSRRRAVPARGRSRARDCCTCGRATRSARSAGWRPRRTRPTAAGRPTSPCAPCRCSRPRSGRLGHLEDAAATAARAVELARAREMPAVLADALDRAGAPASR